MFPTINLLTVDLNTVRRCVLLNYNPATKLIDFRHYNVRVVPVGISKGVKKVVQGKVPDLSKCNDIAEFFTNYNPKYLFCLRAGMLSESEAEDDPQHQVTVPQKLKTRGNVEQGKSAIRLIELGPRLTLSLIKIEDGLLDGEVLYHDLIHKSEEEREEIQRKREIKKYKTKRKEEKDSRGKQEEKEEIKAQLKEKSIKGQKEKSESKTQPENGSQSKVNTKMNQDENTQADDDREYYREEIGEEPDKGISIFIPACGYKRKFRPLPYGNKKRKIEDTTQGGNQSERGGKGGQKRPFEFKTKKRKDFKKEEKGDTGRDRGFKKGGKQAGKGRRVDKTNSANRDRRPVGGSTRYYQR
nr:unnamed protein product [Callosobruchus analis]